MSAVAASVPRYRDVALGGSLAAHFTRRADGSTLVRSIEALAPYPERITDRLLHWAAVAPDRPLVAKRHQGGDWRRVSYAEALQSARSIAVSSPRTRSSCRARAGSVSS